MKRTFCGWAFALFVAWSGFADTGCGGRLVAQSSAGSDGLGAGAGIGGNSGEAGEGDGAHAGAVDAGAAGTGDDGTAGEAGSAGAINPGLVRLAELAAAFCTTAEHCCTHWSSQADCVAAIDEGMPVASVESGALAIDEATAEACREALTAAADGCAAPPPHVCDGLFVRQRALGEACAVGYDCAPVKGGVACAIDAPAPGKNSSEPGTLGVCAKPQRGKAGDACHAGCPGDRPCSFAAYESPAGSTPTVCLESDGLYCNANLRVCTKFAEAFERCTDQIECGPTAACSDDCNPGGACSTICLDNLAGCRSAGFATCGHGLKCVDDECRPAQTFSDAISCEETWVFEVDHRALGW